MRLATSEPAPLRGRGRLRGLVQRRLLVNVGGVTSSREHIRGKLGGARRGSTVCARCKGSVGDLVAVGRVVGERVGEVLRAALHEELLEQSGITPVRLPDGECDVSDKRNEAEIS